MFHFALLAITMLAEVGHAASIGQCDEQKPCMDVTITKNPGDPCSDDCNFRVCLTLNFDKAGCVKDDTGDTVSHSCKRSEDMCFVNSIPDWHNDMVSEIQGLPTGDVQCQNGVGGATLFFLLKDGPGCSGSSASLAIGSSETGTTMQCSPTTQQGEGCSGNPAGFECVWSVVLPTCTSGCVPEEKPACECGTEISWKTCQEGATGPPDVDNKEECAACDSCLDFAPERCTPSTPDNTEVKTFPPRPTGDCNELVTAFSLKHPIVMFVSESNEIEATLITVENLLSQWLIASPAHSIVIYASTPALRNSMWEAIWLSANIPAEWKDPNCGMISVERAVPDPSPCEALDQDINQRKAMFWMRGVLKNRRVWQSVEFARVDPGFALSSYVTAATDPFVSLLAPKLYAFLTEATGCTPQMLNCTSNLVDTPDMEVLCGQYTPQNGRWFELFSTGLLRRKESQAVVNSFINSRALANFGYAEMRFLQMAILLKSPPPADGTVSLCPALPTADCPTIVFP